MKDKIVFLDFDGVVNTPIWRDYIEDGKTVFKCKYAWPYDGFVNNFQAVCWLNYLYETHPFDIVVTSSWRTDCRDYTPEECLRNGGLKPEIEVIDAVDAGNDRDWLIKTWLERNDFKGEYVIFDDVDYYHYDPETNFLVDHLVLTDDYNGITYSDYNRAKRIFEKYDHKKMIDDGLAFADEFADDCE